LNKQPQRDEFQNKVQAIQVSFAISGGYIPEKSQTTNTKTTILSDRNFKIKR
jgi:hypothetical protein